MEFLNPFFLYFLPLVIIPLIINLIPGLSAKKIPFPLYFLLKQEKTGKGLNIRSILKIIIRMLIITTLILIFAHPVIGKSNKKNIVIFDNSIYNKILEKGKPIYLKAFKILNRLSNNTIYIFDQNNNLYPIKNIKNIPILNKPTQLFLPKNMDKFAHITIISSFTQPINVNAQYVDLFPKLFVNAGISFGKLSIVEKRLSLSLFSQNKKAVVELFAQNNNRSISLFHGSIPKNSSKKIYVKIPFTGKIKISLKVKNYEDSFPNDNSIIINIPNKINFNLKYHNTEFKKFLSVLSKKIPIFYSSQGILISEHITKEKGIFFLNKKGQLNTIFSPLLSNQQTFKLYSFPLEKKGTLLMATVFNQPIAIYNNNQLVFGFNFENNNKYLTEAFWNSFIGAFDYGLFKFFNASLNNNMPIKHYKPKGRIKHLNNVKRDYQTLLIIIFIFLLIVEIFI